MVKDVRTSLRPRRDEASHPQIHVRAPCGHENAKKYVTNFLLGDLLNLESQLSTTNAFEGHYKVFVDGQERLRIPDMFFRHMDERLRPLPGYTPPSKQHWIPSDYGIDPTLARPTLPLVFSAGSAPFVPSSLGAPAQLSIDVIGSAFFLLTQYDQWLSGQLDRHGRYRPEDSFLAKADSLERPLVNELASVMASALGITPTANPVGKMSIVATHDIDHPFAGRGLPWHSVLRRAVGDIVHRRSVNLAFRRVLSKCIPFPGAPRDPYRTLRLCSAMNEAYGLQTIFFFKTGKTDAQFDAEVPSDKDLFDLLAEAVQLGAAVGLHPSYRAADNHEAIGEEKRRLDAMLSKLGRPASSTVRFHYLRADGPGTTMAAGAAGFTCDSSMYHSGTVGFRAGTCHPYPLFDLAAQRDIGVRELPLVFMDTPFFLSRDLLEEGVAALGRVVQAARRFGGTIAILSHNDTLATKGGRESYERILETASPIRFRPRPAK